MSLEKYVGVFPHCFDPKFWLKTKMHFFSDLRHCAPPASYTCEKPLQRVKCCETIFHVRTQSVNSVFTTKKKDCLSISSGIQSEERTGSDHPFSVEPDNNNLYHIDDMIVDEYQFQEMYQSKSGKPNKLYRWPKGEVPYE